MIEVVLLLISVLMVFLCGVFVAAEFSFVAVPKSQASGGLKKALEKLSTHISAAQIGITATNLIIGFLAEPSLSRLIAPSLEKIGVSAAGEVAFILAFLTANFFTILFGELVPKNLAISSPLKTARAVQSFQRAFSRLISPALTLLQRLSNYILLLFKIEPQEELATARSAKELASLVRRSAREGSLQEPTALLLEQTLRFRQQNAEDAMTPRSQVKHLAPSSTLKDLVELSKESGHSRFPVLDGEELLGAVHLRQAIAVPPEKRDAPLFNFIQTAPLIPSSFPLHQLMEKLKRGMQLALVIDEFGSFDGLLTLEDLVEEIVGDLKDEHDSENVPLRKIGKNQWEFSGRLRPDEVFRLTGIQLPEGEDWETVSGLILQRLQRIPDGKEKVSLEGEDAKERRVLVELLVNRMDGLRIDRIHMRTTK